MTDFSREELVLMLDMADSRIRHVAGVMGANSLRPRYQHDHQKRFDAAYAIHRKLTDMLAEMGGPA